MNILNKFGINAYMQLLLLTILLGIILPAHGIATGILHYLTYWAVALLFFIYGAKLDIESIKNGMLNIKLQGVTFLATYLLFPILGIILASIFRPVLGPALAIGLIFLAVLPSTVQSSIAFTSMAGGNVSAAICAASVSNLIGVVLTPALVALLMHKSGVGVSLDAVIKITVQILLPFIVGQLSRPFLGEFIKKHKAITKIVDRGSILLIVYSAFSAGTIAGIWHTIAATSLIMTFIVVLVFLAIAMSLMMLSGKLLAMPYPDKAVLFYCGSTKSLASGLPIAAALFVPSEVSAIVLPLMIYHMSQLLVCAFISQKAALKYI